MWCECQDDLPLEVFASPSEKLPHPWSRRRKGGVSRVQLGGGLLQESLELVNVAGALGEDHTFEGLGAICNGGHEFVGKG